MAEFVVLSRPNEICDNIFFFTINKYMAICNFFTIKENSERSIFSHEIKFMVKYVLLQ